MENVATGGHGCACWAAPCDGADQATTANRSAERSIIEPSMGDGESGDGSMMPAVRRRSRLSARGLELGLLLRGEGVLDLHQETDVRALDFPLDVQHLVKMLQDGGLVGHRLAEHLAQLLGLRLHAPLELDGLRLKVLNRFGDSGLLLGSQADILLVPHDQLWREQVPRERVLRRSRGRRRLLGRGRGRHRQDQREQQVGYSAVHGFLQSVVKLGMVSRYSAPGTLSKKSVGLCHRAVARLTSAWRWPLGASTLTTTNTTATATAVIAGTHRRGRGPTRPVRRAAARTAARDGASRASSCRRGARRARTALSSAWLIRGPPPSASPAARLCPARSAYAPSPATRRAPRLPLRWLGPGKTPGGALRAGAAAARRGHARDVESFRSGEVPTQDQDAHPGPAVR